MEKGNFLHSIFSNKMVKILIVTLIAAVSFGYNAYSQDDEGPLGPEDIIQPEEDSDVGKIWLGLRVGATASDFGVNTSHFSLSQDGTYNMFTGGVFLKWQVYEWLALAPEVSYIEPGTSSIEPLFISESDNNFFSGVYPDASVFASREVTESRTYLREVDIPILAMFTPKNFLPKIKPYFLVGPSFGFIINAERRSREAVTVDRSQFGVNLPDGVYSVTNTVDVTSNFRVFDFAANLGVGSRFKIAGFDSSLELRYRWGMSNISNFSQSGSLVNGLRSNRLPQDLTNHTLSLAYSIMFGLN